MSIQVALILLVGLVLAVALGLLFVNNATAAAWVLVAVFVATEGIVPPLELQVTLGSLTLYGLDLVTAPMFVIGVIRLFMRPNPRAVSLPLAALSALFAVYVLSGTAAFGLQAAVTSARPWLYVLGPLIYATQASPQWTRASFRPAHRRSDRSRRVRPDPLRAVRRSRREHVHRRPRGVPGRTSRGLGRRASDRPVLARRIERPLLSLSGLVVRGRINGCRGRAPSAPNRVGRRRS